MKKEVFKRWLRVIIFTMALPQFSAKAAACVPFEQILKICDLNVEQKPRPDPFLKICDPNVEQKPWPDPIQIPEIKSFLTRKLQREISPRIMEIVEMLKRLFVDVALKNKNVDGLFEKCINGQLFERNFVAYSFVKNIAHRILQIRRNVGVDSQTEVRKIWLECEKDFRLLSTVLANENLDECASTQASRVVHLDEAASRGTYSEYLDYLHAVFEKEYGCHINITTC